MNKLEQRRRAEAGFSNGHFRLAVLSEGQRAVLYRDEADTDSEYVFAIACAHCGATYRRRFADACAHLRKHHGIPWWDKVSAMGLEDYSI